MNTIFISEIASNHNKDINRALQFIDISTQLGFDAVKFQLFRLNKLFSEDVLRRSEAHSKRKEWELPLEYLPLLRERAYERGIKFGCTPFYLEAVDVLYDYVDFYKIASYELLWFDLLRRVASTGIPVIISTGMATMSEVIEAVDCLRVHGARDISLLHCVSYYPAPPDACNLSAIETLKRQFPDLKIGWSDHSTEEAVIYRAVYKQGAEIIETHLDIEGRGNEFSMGHSWLPERIGPVIKGIKMGIAADGDGLKAPSSLEIEERQWRRDAATGLRPITTHHKEAFSERQERAQDNAHIEWFGHNGELLDEKDGYKVIDCKECGFIHVIPLPSGKKITQEYKDSYYSSVKPSYLKDTIIDRNWLFLHYAHRIKEVKRLLLRSFSPPFSLVDIGSGPGLFLEFARDKGWDAIGIEPSYDAWNFAVKKGLNVLNIAFEDFDAEANERFHAVFLDHVLEHLIDPKAAICRARDILKDNGVICVIVPNDYNPFQFALKKAKGVMPWWVSPPHHLNYFNKSSLSALLERCGFQVALTEATFPIDLFLMLGEDYINDPVLGKLCHNKRKHFELLLEDAGFNNLRSSLYRSLIALNLGRDIVMYAVLKKELFKQ